MIDQKIVDLLNAKAEQYNRPDFILNDPISIPHLFTKKQDIEIAGFFAATLAWGQRKTIIQKSTELMLRMDNSPHDFIKNATDKDMKSLFDFKHRTFNGIDLLGFVHYFKSFFETNESLENAFLPSHGAENSIKENLISFYESVTTHKDFDTRSIKHVASPAKKSACKRLNMYLRWMVRQDQCGVDFGIWKKIRMQDLICPVDLHVERTINHLGIMQAQKVDWNYAENLTGILRKIDPNDPVKYDFALFGMSVEKFFEA
jgi:uncharacterized protein (TIGR02757 family)